MASIIGSSPRMKTTSIPVPRSKNQVMDHHTIMMEEQQRAYAVSEVLDIVMFNRIVNGIAKRMMRHNENIFCHGHSMEDIAYQMITSRSLDSIYRNHFEGQRNEPICFQNNTYENIRSYSAPDLTEQVDSYQFDRCRVSHLSSSFGETLFGYDKNECPMNDSHGIFDLDL
eukprot:scaffold34265_cov58-Attheya_sp.AAC.11